MNHSPISGLDHETTRHEKPFDPNLSSLVYPYDVTTFMAEFWQQKPLHVAGTEARLETLRELLLGFDLHSILRSADLRQTEVMPPLKLQRAEDRSSLQPAPLDPGSLLLLHAYGGQLYIATSELEGVREWIETISRDLNRVWSAARADIYAAKAGGGLSIHFDKNENFTIQLQGRKVWRYSTEPFALQPLYNSDNRDRLDYRPNDPFDAEQVDPSSLREVCLEPGDMLYVPRGFLHGTQADEDSLSFNLSFNPQPWVDVLLDALRPYLIRDPAWRESASREPGVVEQRLKALSRALGHVRGGDLLGPNPLTERVESPRMVPSGSDGGPKRALQLRRNPLARWNWLPAPEETMTIEIRCPDESATGLEVSKDFLPILEVVPDGPEAITYEELINRFEHGDEDARAFVDLLVEGGLLSWIQAPQVLSV